MRDRNRFFVFEVNDGEEFRHLTILIGPYWWGSKRWFSFYRKLPKTMNPDVFELFASQKE